ncbi:MAG: hypothetical protein V1661_01145 [bacterium]
MSYSMISKKMMEAMGETKAIKIANPLSLDLEYMRVCLLPGLLEAVAENEKNFSEAKLFELARVYLPAPSSFPRKRESQGLPQEELHFAGVSYGKSAKGELFYEAKGFAEKILEKFGIAEYEIKETDDKNMHPARSCDIYFGNPSSHKATKGHGEYLGSYGEIHPQAAKNFGIDSRVGFFYFYFGALAKFAKSHKAYSPIPEYPGIKRDISFVVESKKEYKDIEEAIYAADKLIAGVEVFDIYEGKGVPENKKSIALHILLRSNDRTLETKEADEVWEKITGVLKEKFHAEIRM